MKANVKLGNIWGIPIGLNVSWFLVFALVTLSLSTGYFPNSYPELTGFSAVTLGLFTSLLFFGSVLAHELGHAYVALRDKLPVKSITLFIFGGLAQIGEEPRSPGSEFRIAIAGPLTSIALAGLFAGMWFFTQDIVFLAAPSLYLARINLILAVFNMVPGFPLDGGRVLRALVWGWTKNYARSTQIASGIGQIVAFTFIGLGILSIFTGQMANGLWLAFIGWFLQSAASSANAQLKVQEKLRGVTVDQAMSRDCAVVSGRTSLYKLVNTGVLSGGQHCFFVEDPYGQVQGMVTLHDITRVPQSKWHFMTVEQIMAPIKRLLHVAPNMDLLAALESMEAANVTEAPVLAQDRPVGLLSREQVFRYLQLRTQLGV